MEICISDISTESQKISTYEERVPSSYDALADIARGVARLDNPDVISPYQEVRRKKDTEATCNSYSVRTQNRIIPKLFTNDSGETRTQDPYGF